MEMIQEYAIIIAQVLGFLTIGATILVRLTPNKNDDVEAEKIIGKIWKYINYLPTIGVNPRTQNLEEAYKEMKQK